MRMICPRCGVKGKENAEFCISCGQPLKAAVSSVPPTRISHAPAHRANSAKVVIDSSNANQSTTESKDVSVRYHSVSPAKWKHSTNKRQTGGVQKHGSHVETILHHAAPSRVQDALKESQAPLASPRVASSSPTPAHDDDTGRAPRAEQSESQFARSDEAAQAGVIENMSVSIVLANNAGRIKKITSTDLPPVELQHIWYRITRSPGWNTMALIPASEDLNVLQVAHGLGTMAAREGTEFVRVVNAAVSNTATSNKKSSSRQNQPDQSSFPYEYFDLVKQLGDEASFVTVSQLTRELLGQFDNAKSKGVLRDGKVFVAIDSVQSHPDAISICRAVDQIIVCVKLGQTRFESLKYILENAGRNKLLGCIAIKPS